MTLAAHNFDISKIKFRYISHATNDSLFVFFLFQVRLLKYGQHEVGGLMSF
jgi:hypothetical protein